MIGEWRRTGMALRVPDNGGKGSPPRLSAEGRKARRDKERDGKPSVVDIAIVPENIGYLVR